MSNAVATIEQPRQRSVLLDMSARFGMEPVAFEATVRATCMPTGNGVKPATKEEFAAFLLVAKEYKLNPILKEIYAFPRRGGGIVPVVSIDGWVNLINSQPTCDGFEFEWERDGQGKPISCTCKMYRKDRSHPTVVTEYYEECKRATDPWKMAHRMLRHKALIQAARYAFGFTGIYDEDEAARIAQMKDITPATERPKLADYRAAAEPTDVETSEAETETESAEPFFFTDAFGEKQDEPLDEADFYQTLTEALDQCQVGAAMEQLLGHNQEGIDRLTEDGKTLLLEAIEQNNQRLRALAIDHEKEASKQAQAEKDAAKADSADAAAPAPEEAHPAKAAQEAAAAPAESENPEPPTAEGEPSLVIELEGGDSPSTTQEKAYFAALNKAFKKATVPNAVRRIWAANKPNIARCSRYYQSQIETAARQRVEVLEKAPG